MKIVACILDMMNLRSPETQAEYEIFKQSYKGSCPFCDVAERNPSQIVQQTMTMKVLKNDYPYQYWDKFKVGDHLMIVPVRHTGSFDDFSSEEVKDFFDLLKLYEHNHYSFYSRAPSNTARTIMHLHTHLIKPAAL